MKNKSLLLFTVVAIVALLITSCSSKKKANYLGMQKGNNMSIVVYEVTMKDAVYYGETNKDTNVATYYKVTPKTPDTKFAVVSATVRNDKSTQVIMNVDENSYRLLDKEGKEFPPFDPFKNRELAPNVPNSEGLYQWIWGNFEIQKDFGVTGWTLFEIPKNVKPTQFRWDTVETIYVRFDNA